MRDALIAQWIGTAACVLAFGHTWQDLESYAHSWLSAKKVQCEKLNITINDLASAIPQPRKR
jgi:hypothetical protein